MPKEILMITIIVVFCSFFYCLALAQNTTSSTAGNYTVIKKGGVTITKAKKVEPIVGKKAETASKGKGMSIPLKGTKFNYYNQTQKDTGNKTTTQSFLTGKPLIGKPLKKQ